MSFLRRQVVTAALTANAVRPVPGYRSAVPSFLAGWLTLELAPHALALTALDGLVHAARLGRRQRPGDRAALALSALSTAGLAHMVRQSLQVKDLVEGALTEGLGVEYVEDLDHAPTPEELATPWRKLLNPFRVTDPDVRVDRDVVYDERHGKRGRLDIYRPADRDLRGAPVLLQVHGGAWVLGEKEHQGVPLMQHLAGKGWVCLALNYRLAPRDPWPAQVVDVKRAIAWIRDHVAEYGGDPDYLAITGGSAGGQLCALTAVTPNDPAFQPGFEDVDTHVDVAVPHYGVYDMAGVTETRPAMMMRDRFLAPRVMRRRFRDDPDLFRDASPMLRVGEDAPDFFVIHGTHDSLVPVDQARRFVAELRRRSHRTTVYAELPGAQHAFDVFPSIRSAAVVRAIDRYLQWHWNRHRARRAATEAFTG